MIDLEIIDELAIVDTNSRRISNGCYNVSIDVGTHPKVILML